MSKTLLTNVHLLNTDSAPTFLPGELLLCDGMIAATGAPHTLPRDGATVVDGQRALVSPGLVDVHTHGRAGGDFGTASEEQLSITLRSYLSVGVTTVLPTLASAPLDSYSKAADRIHRAAALPGMPRCPGLHMEGRYLNPAKRGAHAEPLLAPLDAGELAALHERMCHPFDASPVFRLTYAPELDEDGSFTDMALRLGALPSVGHTTSDYATASKAIRRGAKSFTHLFNAMPPLHHRDGGAVAACLDAAARGEDVFGELICDGHHISPEMIRLAYRLLGVEHTLLVTDSMAGAGCPDGDFAIAGEHVTLKDGIARTDTGALAGSTLGLFDAVCNLSRFCGISLAEALVCATRNPARLCGLCDRIGVLSPGRYADLLLIDGPEDAPRLREVWVGGQPVTEVSA